MEVHLSKITKVEGSVVSVASGNGSYVKTLKELMTNGTFNSRGFILYDIDLDRPIGPSIDLCNSIENQLKESAILVKGSLKDNLSKLPDDIALLHIGYAGSDLMKEHLELAFEHLTQNGLLVVEHRNEIDKHSMFQTFCTELLSKKYSLSVCTEGNFSYIKKNRINVIDNAKVKRTPKPEHLR